MPYDQEMDRVCCQAAQAQAGLTENIQVAQLWQKDHASSINDIRWGVNLSLL